MTNTYNRRSNLSPLISSGLSIYSCTIHGFVGMGSVAFIKKIPLPQEDALGLQINIAFRGHNLKYSRNASVSYGNKNVAGKNPYSYKMLKPMIQFISYFFSIYTLHFVQICS